MRKSLISFVALAALVVLGSSVARASETELTLSSGASSYDSGSSSSSSLTYSSSNFNDWFILLETGTSKSPASLPYGVQLVSESITCLSVSGCAPLTITFGGTDFTQTGVPGLVSSGTMSALAGGSVTQNGFYDIGDVLLSTASPIGTLTFTGPVANGSEAASAGSLTFTSAFSLTVQQIFNSITIDAFSGSSNISASPEPRTMLLFGTGLFLVGAFVRRQLRA